MKTYPVRILIQARMSSHRFPGKVLAPFKGKPLIWHILERAKEILSPDQIAVVTSQAASDDPLVSYLERMNVSVFRGELEDVFDRFRSCLRLYPCDWFFRVCGDSPFLNTELMNQMLFLIDQEPFDLITNVQFRTFPKGRSVELIHSRIFLSVNPVLLTPEEEEHPTLYFYRNPDRFKIKNMESRDLELSKVSLAIDSIKDLKRLEQSGMKTRVRSIRAEG